LLAVALVVVVPGVAVVVLVKLFCLRVIQSHHLLLKTFQSDVVEFQERQL
jgi:hypothetical protein